MGRRRATASLLSVLFSPKNLSHKLNLLTVEEFSGFHSGGERAFSAGARNVIRTPLSPCTSGVGTGRLPYSVEADAEGGKEACGDGRESVAACDPAELYRELRNTARRTKRARSDWDALLEIFGAFSKSGWASNQALAVYIGASFYPTAVNKFRGFFFRRASADVVSHLVSLGVSGAAERFLFPLFAEYCMEEFPEEMKRFREMMESADLTNPHAWYPFARAMRRKIVYHCGPTNSGKTHNALQRFMEAEKGVYCSPLRLLAMEVFDKVNSMGVYCSLCTGQERKQVPFARHVACTVEMASTKETYDVAVIDEIQMVADGTRGYAWTRALLGIRADEIHICGDPSVLGLMRRVAAETGDELVERFYERFKPLVVEARTLAGDIRNVRSGDCVVAFSRREIFEVKMAVEKHTRHRCCVIYGALPPETRRQQASLFNTQGNDFDVLVASDAVGMGLNLNIRRVVFYGLTKYNGDRNVPVPASQVKQIAGRAGRRGCVYPDGLTTTYAEEDLEYLIECLKEPFEEEKKAGLFPFYEQVELFAGQMPEVVLSEVLDRFGESCRLDGLYFLCQHSGVKKIANVLERVQGGLSLQDRFNFCFAPVNVRDPRAMYHLVRFASLYSQHLPVRLSLGMPRGSARSDSELLDLETRHLVSSMYLWLSHHFDSQRFPHVKDAELMASDIADLLAQSLIKRPWATTPSPPRKSDPETSNHEACPRRRPVSLFHQMKLKGQGMHKPERVVAA